MAKMVTQLLTMASLNRLTFFVAKKVAKLENTRRPSHFVNFYR